MREAVRNDDITMDIKYENVWAAVSKGFACGLRSIHGPEHWRRVERNGVCLAAKSGAKVEVVRLFAVLHDAKRLDDLLDPRHGERGAKYAASLRGVLFDLTDVDFDLLQHACMWHSHGKTSKDPTIGTCWDSDRLDLTRIGATPEPAFMSTTAGRQLAEDLQAGLKV